MPKTKVLFCAPSPTNKGGITIWSKTILGYFKTRSDNDIDIVHFPMDRSVSLTHLLPIYKKLWYALKDYCYFPSSLWQTLSKKSFDVAHIASVGGFMGSVRDYIFVKICQHFNVLSIVHYHCGTIPSFLKKGGVAWTLQEYVIRCCSMVVVLDDASKSELQGLGISNVLKLPNPLSEELSRDRIAVERKDRALLFVGHVVPEKGIFELINAIKNIENVELNIFGPENSEIKAKLEEQLSGKSSTCHIIFHGKKSPNEIYQEMRQSTLFILPTYTEGFPLVIMEAMACGCPIISTPVGAIKEMLYYENDIQGYLVEPKNVNMLHNTICHCLEHLSEANKKAAKAQEKALADYSVEPVMLKLKTLWMNLK